METAGLKCDFCGRTVSRVRRIALDRDYDRLGQRHAVRYACPDCSERKESVRRAAEAEGRGAAVDARPKPL